MPTQFLGHSQGGECRRNRVRSAGINRSGERNERVQHRRASPIFRKAPDNRHQEGNERVLHRRFSESRWPRPCVGDPRGRSEALDPGCTQAGYRASKWGCPGCRRGRKRRKATSLAAFSRAVSGPCGVEEPEHACDLLMLRTGRSRGCPCLSMMPRPGWFAGWHIGGWRDARGTSRRYALDERAREVGQARSTCEGAEQRCVSGRGGAGGKGPA